MNDFPDGKCRCPWLPADRPLYTQYHDEEWGVPTRDPRLLFEMICLEGMQAGLSWWTILQKREHYRKVFHHFDPVKVAKMTDAQLEKLVLDPGIIRHRGKIFAIRANAQAWLKLENPVEFLWSFVGGKTRRSRFKMMADFQTKTPESDALSKALRKAGFNFVGSTTMHAFMQAVGMVEDHTVGCFRKKEISRG
ncbi:DNA-3-methyladenine glycosylase I [Luteolibacter sp. SL250]|uniref:DNA-3-methyladenine glycosylase I n=1 Tax=Luteolibacter sp. SL250 TaxID=2995170 RepID=UPI00226EFA5F|nr:DNA-3-methyladenine glycosylase I [Luteolibacter sp. SL250]WAC20546.1 DNA-3-methyladenine glycosylase I [Luteolibacter sp. SL250]